MRINNNLMAMNTHRQLGIAQNRGANSMEKLSSGFRINRAGDDAAGLSISEKMRGQIRGLNQASRNAQDGISMIQTAEGALNETHSILQRMRELAVQSSNDTNVDIDREAIQNEVNQLQSEIDRIADTTEFNTQKLLNGDMAKIESGSEITIRSAKSDDYDPSFAVGTTWTGLTGDAPVIEGGGEENEIDFSTFAIDGTNTFTWDIDTDQTNTISIERSGSDILVSITATDDDGDKIEVTNQKMAVKSDGTYTYDANGLEFSISSSEFKNFTDGAKLEIDLNEYDLAGDGNVDLVAQDVGTVSDYSQTMIATGTTLGSFAGDGITVDVNDDDWIDGVEGIRITAVDVEAADGTWQVELLDSEGSAIVDEKYTIANASGDFAYDAHGISFTYTVADTKTLDLEMDFDVHTTTRTISETIDNSATLQIGANEDQTMSISIGDMGVDALGVSSIDLTTSEDAQEAVTTINNAIEAVSEQRSELGAFQNRLEHTISNLDNSSENLQAAESRIRDVDMANEMMELTKQNILQQASTAMLAQANQAPQSVLQLLG